MQRDEECRERRNAVDCMMNDNNPPYPKLSLFVVERFLETQMREINFSRLKRHIQYKKFVDDRGFKHMF